MACEQCKVEERLGEEARGGEARVGKVGRAVRCWHLAGSLLARLCSIEQVSVAGLTLTLTLTLLCTLTSTTLCVLPPHDAPGALLRQPLLAETLRLVH